MALVAVAAAPPVLAADAYQSYDEGVSALKAGDCRRAATALEAAISKDDRESARKRTYGMNFVEYFPHFQLATAYACLGDTPRALRELDTCERQGAYKGSGMSALRRELQAKTAPPTPVTPVAKATPTPAPPPTFVATPTPKPRPTATPSPTVDQRLAMAKAALDAGTSAFNMGNYARAVQSFKEALSYDPGNVETKRYLDLATKEQQRMAALDRALSDGQKALDRGDYAGAKGKAEEVLRLDPLNQAARGIVKRADAGLAQAKTPAVPTPITPTVPTPSPAELNRQKAAAELKLARQLIQSGKLNEAIAHLEIANQLEPANVEITQELATAYKRKAEADRFLEARDEIATARRLQASGNLSEALTHATKAVALDPNSTEARDLRDALSKAMVVAVKTPAIPPPPTPKPPPAQPKEKLREAVRAFYAGSYDDALAKLSAAEGATSSLPIFHTYRGAAYMTKYILAGEQDATLKESAIAAFRKARAIDPKFQPDPAALSPKVIEAFQSAQ